MKKSLLAVAVLAMCALAQAGFVPTDPNGAGFQCTFDDDPTQQFHTWTFTVDEDGSGDLILEENYKITYPGTDSVNMFGQTDSDPIVRITKYVTNETNAAWTGYTLTLNNASAGVSFTGTPTSDGFDDAVIAGNVITFSGGTVAVGEEVALNFRILVENSGSFGWCVTQMAIPEPATLAMLGLGAVVLFRKK